MLQNRLFSAAIVISGALLFVALDVFLQEGKWLIPLAAVLVLGSAWECTDMVRDTSTGNIRLPTLLGCGGIMLAAVVPAYWHLTGEAYPSDCPLGELGWPLAAVPIAIVACFGWFIPSYQPHDQSFWRAILASWAAVYFGACFSFAVALRNTGQDSWGIYLLVGVVIMTKIADAGAYFTGKSIGRQKLCPNVSPGKTVEGLVGGMLASCLAGWIYFCVCGRLAFESESVYTPIWVVVLLGCGLTIAGLFGDLLVSVFKREMGVKDSGRLLPGLGGVWDVTDSLLPAVVAGYLVVAADLLRGPGQ